MKLNKLFLGLLGLAGFVASSCSSSDDYQWATASGEQVYFSNELPSQQNLSKSSTTLTIPVSRVNTSGSTSVNISITSDDNAFTGPSSVSFADGSATTNLVLSYEPDSLGYDNPKNVTLTITDTDKTNAYGYSTYKFTAVIPSPYKLIGKGTMDEGYLWGFSTSVEIYQNAENPNLYRIQNGYALKVAQSENADAPSDYIEVRLLQPGETLFDVPVTMKDLVYFTPTSTGYYLDDYSSTIWLYHPAHFSSMAAESYWTYSRVLAYNEDGTPGQIQLAPRYHLVPDGRGYAANNSDGVCVITFPGYAPKDFSVAMDYQGVLSAADGNTYATIFAELGADSENVLAAVVDADADAEAVADALATGDLEGTAVQNGMNFVQIPEGLTGKLQVVVAVIDGDAVKTVDSVVFEYYGGGKNPWKSLGIGYYTDDIVVPLFTEAGEPYTYQVEILENEDAPGLYRLVNLYAPVAAAFDVEGGNKNIEVNAEHADGVYIVDQLIGLDFGYGDMSIETDAGYYVPQYGYDVVKAQLPEIFGKVENGEITFPVLTSQSEVNYQAWLNMGGKSYYGGMNGALKIVLPTAAAGVKAKARSMAKATSFALRLNGGLAISMKDMKIMKNRRAPLAKAQKIAE